MKCGLVTGNMASVLEEIHASYCADKVYENDKFIKKTKTGDNIMVKSGDDKYVNFASVDFGKRHDALIGIGSHFLSFFKVKIFLL